MNFNRHSPVLREGHALLSPSNYHWINYDEDKMIRVFHQQMATRRGTDLHELGHQCIRLGVRLPASKKTLNQYVNDSIGFKLTPEQILRYSENCYGTADAIGFRNNTLRISDLKTGVTEASFTQLLAYAALFCLEYRFKPNEIKIELRIYQGEEVRLLEPDPHDVFHVMDKIITFSKLIDDLRAEGMY